MLSTLTLTLFLATQIVGSESLYTVTRKAVSYTHLTLPTILRV